MLQTLRTDRWRRRTAWLRAAGIVLLLLAFFSPVPALVTLALLLPGAALFLVGALAWLVRDEGGWRRLP